MNVPNDPRKVIIEISYQECVLLALAANCIGEQTQNCDDNPVLRGTDLHRAFEAQLEVLCNISTKLSLAYLVAGTAN